MKKKALFYSWQSDLPNNTNRGFIESCINVAIRKLTELDQFDLELSIDRDTRNEPGTPDIVETIFTKINNSCIFIADISIINTDSKDRKTPNPNVLLELGYAARALGWERIICVYNTDFGDYADLPFDLRNRRPLSYSLKDGNKATVKERLANSIAGTIERLYSTGLLVNELDDYIKMQADTEFLSVINHLSKLLFGYTSELHLFEKANQLVNLQYDEVTVLLKDRKFLGFQIHKKYEVYEQNVKNIVDKVISSHHYNQSVVLPLVQFVRWLGSFDKTNRLRTYPDLFIFCDEISQEYKVISGRDMNSQNNEFPNRFILLKTLESNQGQVKDFGDFQEKDKIEGLLKYYYLNEKYQGLYAATILDLIQIITLWLDLTNNEFIVDDNKAFEIKRRVNL